MLLLDVLVMIIISGFTFAVLQDPAKAKQFFPFLQRAGKTVALVEVRMVLITWD